MAWGQEGRSFRHLAWGGRRLLAHRRQHVPTLLLLLFLMPIAACESWDPGFRTGHVGAIHEASAPKEPAREPVAASFAAPTRKPTRQPVSLPTERSEREGLAVRPERLSAVARASELRTSLHDTAATPGEPVLRGTNTGLEERPDSPTAQTEGGDVKVASSLEAGAAAASFTVTDWTATLSSPASQTPAVVSSTPRPVRPPADDGECECPYDLRLNGEQCGVESGWGRPDGLEPACYGSGWGVTAIADCYPPQGGFSLGAGPMAFCPNA